MGGAGRTRGGRKGNSSKGSIMTTCEHRHHRSCVQVLMDCKVPITCIMLHACYMHVTCMSHACYMHVTCMSHA